jgi:hypothetical protein
MRLASLSKLDPLRFLVPTQARNHPEQSFGNVRAVPFWNFAALDRLR